MAHGAKLKPLLGKWRPFLSDEIRRFSRVPAHISKHLDKTSIEYHQDRGRPVMVNVSVVRPHDLNTPPARVMSVRVTDLWLECPLKDSRWVVAYKIVPVNGNPIVAEIRVYPNESPADGERPAGRWSGEWFGIFSEVPPGGITAPLLRQVPIGVHRKFGEEFLRQLDEWWLSKKSNAGLRKQGLLAVRSLEKQKRRVGRRPLDDGYLARIAAAYVRAQGQGSTKPIADIAKLFKIGESKARSQIHKARVRGFLSGGGKQGMLGGQLTRKSMELLSRPSSRRKNAEKR